MTIKKKEQHFIPSLFFVANVKNLNDIYEADEKKKPMNTKKETMGNRGSGEGGGGCRKLKMDGSVLYDNKSASKYCLLFLN